MDDAESRQGQGAVSQNLWFLAWRRVFHSYDHTFGAAGEIHGASHSVHHFPWQHPVREVALLVNLETSQDTQIEVTSTNHCVGVDARKQAGACSQGNRFFCSIDKVRIPLVLGGQRAKALDAAF